MSEISVSEAFRAFGGYIALADTPDFNFSETTK